MVTKIKNSMESKKIAQVYDAHYFAHYCGRPYQRDEEWLRFFDLIAERICTDVRPNTVLDAGCAMGFLVECLRRRGVQAFGIDISQYAIDNVHSDVQQYCWIGSVTDPFPQRYDLIVCIEVLEHLPSTEAEITLRNLCRHADDILFSSTPNDFKEATHLNVQPPEYWAELFAHEGFFRDLDFDGSIITPWAVRFRRYSLPIGRIIAAYERRMWHLKQVNDARQELVLEQRKELSGKEQDSLALKGLIGQKDEEIQTLIKERERLTNELSVNERENLALKALIDQKKEELSSLQAAVDEREARLNRIYASHGWKALVAYYKTRDKFLPLGTRRREVAKSVWKLLRLSQTRKRGNISLSLTESNPVNTQDGPSPLLQKDTPSKFNPWVERRVSDSRKDSRGGNARVLVISGDTLPLEGLPTTGAGLRAWGLGEALRSRGHDVVYAMPKGVVGKKLSAGAIAVHLFDPLTLDDVVAKVNPDVLIFQHWPWLAVLREPPRGFVVVDFHGPLLLETHFRDPAHVRQILPSKLVSLSRADYFICAGKKQLYYYLAWLLIAGFDLQSFPISVVPFSLSPDLPARSAEPEDPLFVYGGVFLPWQDPVLGLRILVAEMERLGRGQLRFFGGKHPWLPLSYERFDGLRKELESSARVRFQPTMSRDQLIKEYTGASVAWDLMARNPEREMAFTSRTVEYLWCGLPVVYNNYADLAEYIAEYDAGWVVDPTNEQQIRQTIQQILTDRENVYRKGKNASRLVHERLTWDKTIEPLDRYCRNPYRADRKEGETLLDKSVMDSFQPASVIMSPEVIYFVGRIKALLPASSRQFLKSILARSRTFKR
jgi:glycosyltransferase involved in cell wall biosynthesis